jgi:hypothetical protein
MGLSTAWTIFIFLYLSTCVCFIMIINLLRKEIRKCHAMVKDATDLVREAAEKISEMSASMRGRHSN